MKKVLQNLTMLVMGNIPVLTKGLSREEVRRYWIAQNPNHEKETPNSTRFTDFVYNVLKTVYRNPITGSESRRIFLQRTPHAYLIGQEMYGRTETTAIIKA